jgi:hypothetical protein
MDFQAPQWRQQSPKNRAPNARAPNSNHTVRLLGTGRSLSGSTLMLDRPDIVVRLDSAFRKNFEDILREPVPARLKELISRLEAAEAARAENGGPWREIVQTSLDPSDSR